MRARVLLVLSVVALGAAACTGDGTQDDEVDAGSPARSSPRATQTGEEPGDEGAGAEAAEETTEPPPGDPPEDVSAPAPEYPLYGVAYHFLAHVHAEPSKQSEVVGHMRRGARFRASERLADEGCEDGWYAVPGGGHVCRGAGGYLLGREPRSFEPAPMPAALEEPLPYVYGRVVRDDVPQYWRLPSKEEEAAFARWLEARDRTARATEPATADAGPADGGAGVVATPDPDGGADGAVDAGDGRPDFVRLVMRRGFYVSIDREAETEDGRRFIRTVRGTFVPEEAVAPAPPPPGPGVRVGRRHRLPLAFVFRDDATRWRIAPDTGALVRSGRFDRFEAFTARQRVERGGRPFVVAPDGSLARDTVVRIARARTRPSRVPEDGRWVHVDLSEQTLVAYEGDRPVYATLVSSGRRGFETPTGLWWIQSKHVTATMDDLASEDPYLIEDVPWAMYFEGSYALHGAFWHRGFGRVRSHGCVNLAPEDAHWLFRWATPSLPPSWHGVLTRGGRRTTHVLVEE
ncbi:MAG: L,D-transpeptidase [Myxococcota bacterium]